MYRCLLCLSLSLLLGHVPAHRVSAAEPVGGADRPVKLSWHTDYGKAAKAAIGEKRMLLVFFEDGRDERFAKFESGALADPEVMEKLRDAVRVKLAADTKIRVKGEEIELLTHDAYAELHGTAGVALLDFAHKADPYYGCVVEAYPFTEGGQSTARQMVGLPDAPAEVPIAPAEPAAPEASTTALKPPAETPAEGPEEPIAPPSAPPAERAGEVTKIGELDWYGEYGEATDAAKREGKIVLIFFEGDTENSRRFKSKTLSDPAVVDKLERVVRVKLPVDAKILVGGEEVELLKHTAFAEMLGKAGVAMIDFTDKGARQYGAVVSTFPFLNGSPYNMQETLVILDLPPGTLTQRSLIYAVRTHPERPASTDGQLDPVLVEEAERHSKYQARLRLQGHHQWETRFHRINGKLPAGLTSTEVCAESWPGEGLLEAAIECVRCWHFSAGHWGAVSAPQRLYGYDMKRGSNRIWYATGIFGHR